MHILGKVKIPCLYVDQTVRTTKMTPVFFCGVGGKGEGNPLLDNQLASCPSDDLTLHSISMCNSVEQVSPRTSGKTLES